MKPPIADMPPTLLISAAALVRVRALPRSIEAATAVSLASSAVSFTLTHRAGGL